MRGDQCGDVYRRYREVLYRDRPSGLAGYCARSAPKEVACRVNPLKNDGAGKRRSDEPGCQGHESIAITEHPQNGGSLDLHSPSIALDHHIHVSTGAGPPVTIATRMPV